MYDWPDADDFAEKSLAANTGQRIAPQTIGDWDIESVRSRHPVGWIVSVHAGLQDGSVNLYAPSGEGVDTSHPQQAD